MKRSSKTEFIIGGLMFLSLFTYVYAPIYFTSYKLKTYIGKSDSELIQEFGQPTHIVTIQQIEEQKPNWKWWGDSYGPKPTHNVSHKAYGYPKSGFIIFWVYINTNGVVEHVTRVGT